jgi:hypothetical protein
VGMNSESLSIRSFQPGNDRSFETSEDNFSRFLLKNLDHSTYRVDVQPKELLKCFSNEFGVKPEAMITNKKTGKKLFIEVKKQGDQGNAEERLYKHHTKKFYELMHKTYGYDYHPFVAVLCESLAVNPRYTVKFKDLLDDGQYCLWEKYDETILKKSVEHWLKWLD